MQHMPDKEFDNLFRDRFKDAEITPSANLWANIESQLAAPVKKRTFPVYWMAAATIAIAFTAMLVFQKTEKIQLRAVKVMANVAEPSAQQTQAMAGKEEIAVSPVATAVQSTKVLAAVKVKTPSVSLSDGERSTNTQLAMQPMINDERLPIKQAEVRPLDVLPTKEIIVETPVVIAAAPTKEITEQNIISETESSSTERKGIRNVGDIVNFVVDKVDKRQKKLLMFNTDDDDNSSIIGINIGFLKLNSKKHK